MASTVTHVSSVAYHSTQSLVVGANPSVAPTTTSRRTGLIRRVARPIIAVVIVLGIISSITSLVFRPRVPNISVDSLSVAHFNVSGSQKLTANWVVGFHIQNSNKKMSMFYDSLQTLLIYKGYSLSETSLEPLYLEKMNEKWVNAKLVIHSDYVDEWVVDNMGWDQSSGVMSFDVRMRGLVKFEAKSWPKTSTSINVYGGNLMVGLSIMPQWQES